MFYNPDTKEPGLVADLRQIRDDFREFKTKASTAITVASAFVSVGALAGIATAVRTWLAGP